MVKLLTYSVRYSHVRLELMTKRHRHHQHHHQYHHQHHHRPFIKTIISTISLVCKNTSSVQYICRIPERLLSHGTFAIQIPGRTKAPMPGTESATAVFGRHRLIVLCGPLGHRSLRPRVFFGQQFFRPPGFPDSQSPRSEIPLFQDPIFPDHGIPRFPDPNSSLNERAQKGAELGAKGRENQCQRN